MQIIAFGANHHHQLGVTPHVEACLRPRHVNLSGVRNAAPISGICAAKYHSVFFNENVLLVCGLNAGQLGPKSDSPYITVPQLVSSYNLAKTRSGKQNLHSFELLN